MKEQYQGDMRKFIKMVVRHYSSPMSNPTILVIEPPSGESFANLYAEGNKEAVVYSLSLSDKEQKLKKNVKKISSLKEIEDSVFLDIVHFGSMIVGGGERSAVSCNATLIVDRAFSGKYNDMNMYTFWSSLGYPFRFGLRLGDGIAVATQQKSLAERTVEEAFPAVPAIVVSHETALSLAGFIREIQSTQGDSKASNGK